MYLANCLFVSFNLFLYFLKWDISQKRDANFSGNYSSDISKQFVLNTENQSRTAISICWELYMEHNLRILKAEYSDSQLGLY